ncbi:MAG: hypothetical protein AAGD12_11375, partial [Pseudomonadota bacterium]
ALFGGSGDDSVVGVLGNGTNHGPSSLFNVISGKDGEDTLYSIINSGSNVAGALNKSVIKGGADDDTILTDIVAGGIWKTTTVSNLFGGTGNDMITAQTKDGASEDGGSTFTVEHRLEGGSGSDLLDAQILVTGKNASSSGMSLTNHALGGAGDDTVIGTIGIDAKRVSDAQLGSGTNMLQGGGGSDRLTSEFLWGAEGVGHLSGGGDNDTLTVVGGSGNLLRGDQGNDILDLTASAGVDVLQFQLAKNGGSDRVIGWDIATDQLNILELAGQEIADPLGAGVLAGLAGRVELVDDGTDVLMVLDGGTRVIFAGIGTGAVESLEQLFADVDTQLISEAALWDSPV